MRTDEPKLDVQSLVMWGVTASARYLPARFDASAPIFTRLAARQERSAPILLCIDTWLNRHRTHASAKSPLGEALAGSDRSVGRVVVALSDRGPPRRRPPDRVKRGPRGGCR